MTSLADEILGYWRTIERGYSQQIRFLSDDRWPAWALHLPDETVGVAIPYPFEQPVIETFANVRLEAATIANLTNGRMLILTSYEATSAFAAVCAQFIAPGENGVTREAIVSNPVAWWREWKGLLGNKNVEKRVYDILGELIGLAALKQAGCSPIWTGPDGISTDIDCGTSKYEVKSSVARNSRTFEAHGLFQLSADSVPKYLIFAQFEPSENGLSIDGLVAHLASQGYSLSDLNASLNKLGYPEGASSRTTSYRLISLSQYDVNDEFPRIEPSSFTTGSLPRGVLSITYTVSLDGLNFIDLLTLFPDAIS